MLYLSKNPFTAIYTADYFDGALEGLVFWENNNSICRFQKKWWVEGQCPRLFLLEEIFQDDCSLDNKLIRKLKKKRKKLKYLKPYPILSQEYEAAVKYFESNKSISNTYYCFGNSILSEIALTKTES